MLQQGDEDEPRFHGGTEDPGKHNEKPENKGGTSVILTVILVIIVIVALLFGAYYFRHLWYKGKMPDFM
jgi:hypothetical protein